MNREGRHPGYGSARQLEVLAALAPTVRRGIEEHLQHRRLWFPDELLSEALRAHDPEALAALRAAAAALPPEVGVAVALNLLTEEGLPHFHRLIATHMGEHSPWSHWNNLWTAEEDRHGCALRDWARDSGLFRMRALEELQYRYIESGFNPDWQQDPYRLLAYTSLQEKATQLAHANTGRRAAGTEPQLQRVLAHLAADESRHYRFYREMFGAVLAADPDAALQSLLSVMPSLAMPGHSIEGYEQMSEVVRRSGIYGAAHYLDIVEELLEHWGIAALRGLGAAGAAAQEKLMRIPARLRRMAEYLSRRETPRRLEFAFLPGRAIVYG